MKFWDTSALVPLLIEERTSDPVRAIAAADTEIVVWWGASVECLSAISRLERAGRLKPPENTRAFDLLGKLRGGWKEIEPLEIIASGLEELLRAHPLRAADALQLAAALLANDRQVDRTRVRLPRRAPRRRRPRRRPGDHVDRGGMKRLAVIGLGQRIAHVIRALAATGWSLEVAGHVDPAPVGAPILEEAGIGQGRPYASIEALFAAGPYDLVMIGSPNHRHLAHLEAAIAAGWPIFVEKPIVRTAEETFALARRLAAGRAPPIFVGLVMRSMPIVREVLARAGRGELGTLVSMDATEHLHPEHGAYLARNWRRRAEWGGSFLLDKVCHDFDIFGALAGGRARKVASFGGQRIFTPAEAERPRAYDDGEPAYALRDAGWAAEDDPFASDMDVTDHQTAIVEYETGLTLSFHANSHVALQERRWYLSGTRGTLIADLVRNRLMVRGALARGKPERMEFGNLTADLHNGADEAMAADLLAALEGRAAFPVTPWQSIEAGLTVMAIDEARETGAVVDLAATWMRLDAAKV